MATKKDDVTEEGIKGLSGKFIGSLLRNNAKIREDRAFAIYESAQIIYKREIEDTELQIKQLIRERDALLDLSPTNSQSLVLKADFNEKEFVEKDIDLGIKIRNLTIILDVARERYSILFDKE